LKVRHTPAKRWRRRPLWGRIGYLLLALPCAASGCQAWQWKLLGIS